MDTFQALAEPNRRIIVEMLAKKGKLSATDISRKFRISPPAVSQHLKVLRLAKLVTVEKRAQQRIYQINPTTIHDIEVWAQKLATIWNNRYDRLEQLLVNKMIGGEKYGKK